MGKENGSDKVSKYDTRPAIFGWTDEHLAAEIIDEMNMMMIRINADVMEDVRWFQMRQKIAQNIRVSFKEYQDLGNLSHVSLEAWWGRRASICSPEEAHFHSYLKVVISGLRNRFNYDLPPLIR